MAKRATTLTGAAGEHYVAYKLSAMGYPTALTRGGSPVIDLMVGDLSGNGSVSIQVKTRTAPAVFTRGIRTRRKIGGSGMSVAKVKSSRGRRYSTPLLI